MKILRAFSSPSRLGAFIATALVLTCGAAALGRQETPAAPPPKDGPLLKLGRASLSKLSVARGSVLRCNVLLANEGKSPAHVTSVAAKEPAVGFALIQQRARRDVENGKPIDPAFEVPAGQSARLEISIDAKERPLGEGKTTVVIENDGNGGKSLELPVDWEVVEPLKEGEEDKIARPRTDINAVAPKGPPPHIECDRYTHDFGTVLCGERVTTKFTLKNSGEGPLLIQKVGAQCHCTLAGLTLPGNVVINAKKIAADENYGILKPGEEATLDCQVDTAGMGGFHKKTILVYSNDLARLPLPINLTMTVENPFPFSPSSANFGAVRRAERAERIVRMSSVDQGKFVITGYELPQPPAIDVDFREVPPRKNEVCAWELLLRARADVPCKQIDGKLTLKLEHDRVHAVFITYSLKVLPDVEWLVDGRRAPDNIQLGVVRPGLHDVKSIILENRNDAVPYIPKEARVESRLGNEPYDTEIVELEKGKRYEIKLKIARPPKTKSLGGELVILADHATMPELRMRFAGIWNGASDPPPAPTNH